MKFTVDGSALNKALKQLLPAINQNKILPILDYIHCSVKKKKCFLMGTNTHLTITVTVQCSSDKEFEMLLPFKELLNISSVLSAQPLTIDNADVIIITSLKEKYKLGKAEDISNFPKLEQFVESFSFEADADFLNNFQLSKNCVSKANNEYIFQDVHLDIKDGTANIVATDNMQFFKYSQKVKKDISFKCLISTDFIKSLSGINKATIIGNEKFLKIESETMEIVGTVSEQKFPDYSVFFKEYKHNCTVQKNDLAAALGNMMIFDKGIYICQLIFKKDAIVLKFNDFALERDFETEIPAIHSVDFESIFFSAQSFRNLLSLLPDNEEIFLSFTDPKSLVHIDINDSNVNTVIIPIKQN